MFITSTINSRIKRTSLFIVNLYSNTHVHDKRRYIFDFQKYIQLICKFRYFFKYKDTSANPLDILYLKEKKRVFYLMFQIKNH